VKILRLTSPWVFPVSYRIALSPSILPPPPSQRTVCLALLLSATLTHRRLVQGLGAQGSSSM